MPIEAAFLASVIPNPTPTATWHDRGAISEAWRRRVDAVLLKMAGQGVLGDEDLARALPEPVVFVRG
jgi:membrane peptidoglycan carboxypeptidase